MRRSCALNARYVQVPLCKQWSCVWILCNQGCVGSLQGMQRTSWHGCDCDPTGKNIPDRGKNSRRNRHFYRIARVGALRDLNKQNSKGVVDSHGRRCIRQSRPQFRYTSRDGSPGAHEDSNYPKAWRLQKNKLSNPTELRFCHKATYLLRWPAQPTALVLALDPSLRAYGSCCVGVPRHGLPDIPPLLRYLDSGSSRVGGCPRGRCRPS